MNKKTRIVDGFEVEVEGEGEVVQELRVEEEIYKKQDQDSSTSKAEADLVVHQPEPVELNESVLDSGIVIEEIVEESRRRKTPQPIEEGGRE